MKSNPKARKAALLLGGCAAPAGWILFTCLTRNHFGLEDVAPELLWLCLGLSVASCLTCLLTRLPGPYFGSWSRVVSCALVALAAAGWLFTLTGWTGGWHSLWQTGRLTDGTYNRLLWCGWGGLVTSLGALLPGVLQLLKPETEI